MLYLSIYEGDDPDHTEPVLGSTDPAVIRGVLEVLARRLGARSAEPGPARELRSVSRRPTAPADPSGDA